MKNFFCWGRVGFLFVFWVLSFDWFVGWALFDVRVAHFQCCQNALSMLSKVTFVHSGSGCAGREISKEEGDKRLTSSSTNLC